MSLNRFPHKRAVLAIMFAATLAGCAATPMGPTVQVMPGPRKSFEQFQADQEYCKGFAQNQVAGQAQSANNTTVGTAALTTVIGAAGGALVGAAFGNAGAGAAVGAGAGLGTGAAIGASNNGGTQYSIQQQYNNAFSQCMYSKGHQVAGMPVVQSQVPAPPLASQGPLPDPLVRSTQSQLMRLGYLNGGADGFMGPKTRTAITSYEQAQGMAADGTPSSALLARLRSTPSGATAQAQPMAQAQPVAQAAAPAPPGWVPPGKTAP